MNKQYWGWFHSSPECRCSLSVTVMTGDSTERKYPHSQWNLIIHYNSLLNLNSFIGNLFIVIRFLVLLSSFMTICHWSLVRRLWAGDRNLNLRLWAKDYKSCSLQFQKLRTCTQLLLHRIVQSSSRGANHSTIRVLDLTFCSDSVNPIFTLIFCISLY